MKSVNKFRWKRASALSSRKKKFEEIGLVGLRYEKYYDRQDLPIICLFYQAMGNICNNSEALWVVFSSLNIKVKVKWSRYRPGVAQRVGRGIALLFHDRGTGRGWVVSSTPRPRFTPGKDPVSILQEAGWAPGSVWTGGKSRPKRDSISDRPARSQSLYRLSYRAHSSLNIWVWNVNKIQSN